MGSTGKALKSVLAAVMFLILTHLNGGAYAEEQKQEQVAEKKYCFSVASLIKNEGKYLKEWIEYHKLVGVDHFYLYNSGSRDRSREALAPYIKEGIVTLIDWPNHLPSNKETDSLWALTVQLPAYENAAKYRAIKESKWLAVLDVDEFIVPVRARTIPEVLADAEELSGILVTTDYFDASEEHQLSKRNLVTQTVTMTSNPEQKIEKSVQKIILKPDSYTTFTWPPYKCNFKEGAQVDRISKGSLRINKYLNRNRGPMHFGKRKDKSSVDNRGISHEELQAVLEVGYEVEDQERAIFRFIPELLKKLGFERDIL